MEYILLVNWGVPYAPLDHEGSEVADTYVLHPWNNLEQVVLKSQEP
jgi:hypothetical protein